MSNFTKYFKQLDLVFITILSTQIFMALIFFILRDMGTMNSYLLEYDYLPIIILVTNTTSILLSKYFFTARNRIDKKLPLDQRYKRYKSLSLLIIAILDFSNVVNIVIYFLTDSQVYLLVALLVLILYIVYRPNKIKFGDMSLTSEEKHELFSEE